MCRVEPEWRNPNMTAHRERPPTAIDQSPSEAPEEAPEHGSLVVVQERVLAEISHELGNFFHKLYYWSDYIKSDTEGARKADSTAGHMLERTISNLEDFLKVALEYFYPIRLNFTKTAVGELLDAFMTHLSAHLNGNEVRVFRDEIGEPATILIDPARISQAFRIALHQVHEDLKSGGALTVGLGKVTRRDFPGLEVRLSVEPKVAPSPLFRTAEAGVEWAVAQKLIEMHGGEIVERCDANGRRTVVIFLPLYV
jgi:signal transduction histidine kinase